MRTATEQSVGALLVGQKIITQIQLDEIVVRKNRSSRQFIDVLFESGFVTNESAALSVFAEHCHVEYVCLKDLEINQEVVRKVPAKYAIHYKMMPFAMSEDIISVAISRMDDLPLMDEISLVLQSRIKLVFATDRDIAEAIRKYYGVGAETIDEMMGQIATEENPVAPAGIDEIDSEASISKFLNQILVEAYHDRATDIHIEPFQEELQIRYRVDGILYDAKVPANIKHFKDAINSRIKILSNLNIAEKRMPQDGRFKVRVDGMDLDLRVSFLPSQFGESVVIRVLNSSRLYQLEELGFSTDELTLLKELIQRPHGILFLTGPTGSGKTTTLYSCLSHINTLDKKIITIEDPVEYQIKGIIQVQINPSITLTFAKGLRSMLRHDPDVMMVGEVRDKETAEIAVQIALTGHLMFSTLHTNDAASGVTRLVDMGVEPFLIASTVQCFIAQRLVRAVCPNCKTTYNISEQHRALFKNQIGNTETVEVARGTGCELCHFTGYKGREAIYEFLLVNDPIRKLIMKKETAGEIREQAVRQGMKTLRCSGWELVKRGVTSPEEVIRVTQEDYKN